jgi:REP element-mobilizing transposase RayT
MALPLAYLLTFTCYGSHLHGDERGSVDREHNHVGSRGVNPYRAWVNASRSIMTDECYRLDEDCRRIVLASMRQVCEYRQWDLIAAHVRTTHVHAVVSAGTTPEVVLHDFKAYATRSLNKFEHSRRRWTRHGSTRYLWTRSDVDAAADYVVRRQGEPMEVYCGSDPRSMTVAAP